MRTQSVSGIYNVQRNFSDKVNYIYIRVLSGMFINVNLQLILFSYSAVSDVFFI